MYTESLVGQDHDSTLKTKQDTAEL